MTHKHRCGVALQPAPQGDDPFPRAIRRYAEARVFDSPVLYRNLACSVRRARTDGAVLEDVLTSVTRVITRELAPEHRDWADERLLAAQFVAWAQPAYQRAY